ncbi:MAG: hypothetical protein BroJett018_49160 [Chloroflexota bacterium]|nr:MAG: hypothetical protein BroJett018_49160 [Chloroflexota bacterium]
MSSRKRRDRMQHGDAFDLGETHTPSTSLQDFADKLYSTGGGLSEDLKKIDAKTVRVKNVPIDKVRPDPAQARRVMPAALRGVWLREPNRIHQVLGEWLEIVDAEAQRRGRPSLDVPALLESDPEASQSSSGGGEESSDPDMGPIEADFRAMLQLAASIRHHGLTNPITVVQGANDTYVVETGERRLLAYNLLSSLHHIIEGDWATIPARVVDSKSVWRQAAENGARQNLNAISIARQLALLLMDIYQRRGKFAPYDDMPGADWYAQVADAKMFAIPYGRGNELAAAMGLKNAVQLRQYRQLLRLPNEVWEIADQYNWTEWFIRRFLQDARSLLEEEFNIILPHKSVTAVTNSKNSHISDDHKSVTAVTNSKNSHISESHKDVGGITDLWLEAVKEDQQARQIVVELARRRAEGIPLSDEELAEEENDDSWKLDTPFKSKRAKSRKSSSIDDDGPRPQTMVKKAGAELVDYDPHSRTLTLRFEERLGHNALPSGGRWLVTLQYVNDPNAIWDQAIYDHFNRDEDEE